MMAREGISRTVDRRQCGGSREQRWTGLLSAALLMVAGCAGGEPGASLVTGKVLLDSQPVSGGSVLLLAADGQGASAEVQPDGSYSLKCLPGEYQVAISPPPPPDPLAKPNSATPGVNVPRPYQDVGTSGLTIVVADGGTTQDFQLVSKVK